MISSTHLARSVAGLLIVLAAFGSPALATSDLWTVNIDNGPAPPPRDRPPFSRGARYDPSLLKYQIPGIVGGYVGFVLIIAFALLTFGRRLRREAQSSSKTLSMEMVKPLKRTLDPSPISPSTSTLNWRRWGPQSHKGTPSQDNDYSPEQPSIVSFDDNVIEKDKLQRQEEMERLYAAVMSDNTNTPRPISVRARDVDVPTIKNPIHTRNLSSSSRSFSHPHPPLVRGASYDSDVGAHGRPIGGNAPPTQAIYPPPPPPPPQPRNPVNNAIARPVNSNLYPHPPPQHNTRPPIPPPPQSLPVSPRSGRGQTPVQSHSRQNSSGSTRSRTGRSSVRNLQISAPIPIPVGSREDFMDDRTPLSPHYIPSNPPRPPSPPSHSRPETPIEDDYDEDEIRREYDEEPPYYSEARPQYYDRPTGSVIHAYGGEDIDVPRPPPLAAPQRSVPNLTIAPPQTMAQTSTSSLPIRQPSRTSPSKTGTPTNTLPFRAFHPPTPASPTRPAPMYQSVSPGPLKTTFLSPRRDRFLPGGMNPIGPGGVPNSAALLSAGLATPYSPYMPFSPMTPVTPHLTNRRERRAREREEGRAVATEDDKVQNDKDLWGDAW